MYGKSYLNETYHYLISITLYNKYVIYFFIIVVAILFYPILPVFAYIRLMWNRQESGSEVKAQHEKSKKEQTHKKDSIPIPDDDNLANLIAAIAGGIEAPIQFILQVGYLLIASGIMCGSFRNVAN